VTQTVEVAEDGTITVPHEALPTSRPGARYRLQMRNGEVRLLPETERPAVPDEAAAQQDEEDWNKWETEWKALSDDLTAAWPEGVSAVDAISEMRR